MNEVTAMNRNRTDRIVQSLATGSMVMTLAFAQCAHGARAPRDPFNGRQSYSGSNMSCLVANDFYAVHFTAMRAGPLKPGDNTAFTKYCQEIPATGRIHLSIDLLDRDVRATPIALRVVEESLNEGGGRPPEVKKTINEVPPKIYRNGTADTDVEIDKPGHYALIATIGDDAVGEDDRLRIPFSVGLPAQTRYGLFGKFTGALVIVFFTVMAVIGYKTFRAYRRGRGKSAEDKQAVGAELG
jgi:hypothetical protein